MGVDRFLGSRTRNNRQKTGRFSRRSFWKTLLGVTLFITAIYYFIYGDLFIIKNIRVEGNRFITKESISRVVEAREQKKRWLIIPERNIFFFNDSLLIFDFNNTRLDNLVVERKLPHSILVTVTEKVPSAFWENQGRWYELHESGLLIGEVGAPALDKLRITNTGTVEMSEVGETVVSKQTLEKIQEIDANLPPINKLRFNYYDVIGIDSYEIRGVSADGWQVLFSTRLDVGKQMRKLEIFWKEKSKSDQDWPRSLEYIDVKFGNTRVYYK